MGGKSIILSYGRRENAYITCTVDFEVHHMEKEWFDKDQNVYEKMILDDLQLKNFIFEIGIFCGKNSYTSFLLILSMEIPGRLIIELPPIASLNINHYKDLKEFLSKSLGFEIK